MEFRQAGMKYMDRIADRMADRMADRIADRMEDTDRMADRTADRMADRMANRLAGGLEGEVRIEITGGQGQIRNCHEGRCYLKNGHIYVLFSETLTEDGKQGKTFSSRLKVSENEVILRRSLPNAAEKPADHKALDVTGGKPAARVMEFAYRIQAEDDLGCMVDYPTPYGLMRLEIRTTKLEISQEAERLEIQIEYTMLQEGQEINRDSLSIHVYSIQ
jgi:uncharacterized beta-barrel protein YwiB (DUF1934 family)